MFNGGSFNHKRFNLRETKTEVQLQDSLEESLLAQLEAGQNVHLLLIGEERLNELLYLGSQIDGAAALGESLSVLCQAVANYNALERLRDSLGAAAILDQNCHITDKLLGSVLGKLDLGENIHLQGREWDSFGFAGALAAIYQPEAIRAYEILNSLVSTAVFDTLYISLDVTIPPGGKLVLDSEHFLALLDGENVLDKHSGDWLELSRNVEEIRIEGGGTTNLTATLLYTERYL